MRNRRFRKTLVMMLVFILVMSNFMSVTTFATSETTNFVKVHTPGFDNNDIATVEIYYVPTTEWLMLSPQGQHYNREDYKAFINENISKIRVTLDDGTVLIFDPASDYKGVEGGGTINYWIAGEDVSSLEVEKIITDYPNDNTSFEVTVVGPNGFSEVFYISQDQDPLFEFPYLVPGNYTLTETDNPDYNMDTPKAITLVGGGSGLVTFVNEKETGSIIGTKFLDLNGNGVWDKGESGLEGWTIFVDTIVNGYLDPGEPFDVTDVNGLYEITDIPFSTWNIYEEQQLGWTQTLPNNPNYYTVTFSTSTVYEDYDFGNWADITKSGFKFNDLNGNGIWDKPDEPGLPGFTIFVDYDDDAILDEGEPFAITGVNGEYTITNIVPGFWKIREIQIPGWTQTYPTSGYYEETFISGMVSEENNFGNILLPTGIRIIKDVTNVTDDPTEFGFIIYLRVDGQEDVQIGIYRVSELLDRVVELPPGDYYIVEYDNMGYFNNINHYSRTVVLGEITDVTFYNELEEPPETFSISGYVFEDIDEDNTRETTDYGYPQIEVTLDGTTPVYTDIDGFYEFIDVLAGPHVITVTGTVPDPQVTEYDGTLGEEVDVTVGPDATLINFGYYYEEPPETFSISGYVFEDIDEDNTVDSGEIGYGSIAVDLLSGSTVIASTVTDSSGEYLFAGLFAGSYTVEVTGTVPDPQVSEYDSSLNGSVDVTVGPDATLINFGYYYEEPPEDWLVHGYVFYDENENNTKDTGESGFAEIELYLDGNPAHSAITNSDGYYEFAGIPGTSHDVVVTVETTVPADLQVSEYDGTPFDETVEVVFGSEYDEPLINFGYKDQEDPEYYTFHGYVWEDANLDGIVHYSEHHYTDIELTLHDGSTTYTEYTWEGYYVFNMLELVGPIIYITVDGPNVEQVYEYDGTLNESIMIDLMYYEDTNGDYFNFGYYDEEEPEYELSIDKVADDYTVKVGDTITYTVTVTNTGDLYLCCVEVTDSMFGDLDDHGDYFSLEPGESKVFTRTKEATEVGTLINIATAQDFEMQVGPVSDDAVVTVTDDPPPPSKYTLSGYVFVDNNSDNLVNGEDVGYEGITVELYHFGGTTPIRTDTTDANGKYSFSSLRGEYTVVVASTIEDNQVSEYDSTLNQEVDVSMYSTKYNVNFGYVGPPLSTPVVVSGYVFNDIDEDNAVDTGEKGYENIPVQLRNSLTDEIIKSVLTNADGFYVISAFLDAGEYVIVNDPFDHMEDMYDAGNEVSEYDDLLDEVIDITVVEGVENVFTERNFGYEEVPKGVTTVLSGYVFNDLDEDNAVDAGETGYSSVEVTIWSNGLPLLVKTTNANGMYVFDFLTDPELNGLEAGEYTITIGDTPANIHQVSEYDGSPFNKIVILALTDDTEAIANINFGFKDNVVPSGEEANIPLMLFGLFLITSGILIRRKSYNH